MHLAPSVDHTRLTEQSYLAHLDSDVEALLHSSVDYSLRVPGCSEWNLGDLLGHLVAVYRHKIVTLETGQRPSPGSWTGLGQREDPRAALESAYQRLRELLHELAPEHPAWTFSESEQTVAFWHRRMAQETAIHRWDAQSARGVETAEPIETDLADDGIDEFLGWLQGVFEPALDPVLDSGNDDKDDDKDDGEGTATATLLLQTQSHAWLVALRAGTATVVGRPASLDVAADATLRGSASGLVLEVWGRPGEHEVETIGNSAVIAEFRARAAALGN